ncbi:hypothetical protein P152DRAFT_455849 [Eremomyces bilateralis CBS 781.70]|uniref:Uncharacterized protein n=1 Tax=Eremomyces bilateralis CBS 781.70 TaxID=1392243 RepID=A0A6G1G9P7_9PEZI|nr:uncharacterized protein P152DRAFT_455849 [Eremomyces bilateralis CBS 781.70]KAF1814807.1 hypothetical protein P152DRAFT_455849 [Eremomyces bilateralis CBS 781.70]
MKVEGETLLTEGIFWETVDLVCDTVVPNDSTTGQLDAVMEAWQQFVDEAAEREDLQSYAIEYLQNNLASEYEYPTEGWKEFLSLDRIQANRYGDPPKTAKEVDEYHNMLDLKAVRSQLVDPAFKYDPYGHDLIRKNLVRYGTGRRLGLSTQGFIGLFPADVQEGDSIALVVGAPLPIVLRHVGGGEHVLVDEAWMPMVAGDELEESPRVTIRIV